LPKIIAQNAQKIASKYSDIHVGIAVFVMEVCVLKTFIWITMKRILKVIAAIAGKPLP
jgi:hypothetical protein